MTNHQIDVRKPWHQTKQGCWSLTLAGEGITVRVTQRKSGQPFQRILLDGAGRQHWTSLGTTDRDEAERRARAFLRALLALQREAGEHVAQVAPAAAVVPEPSTIAVASTDAGTSAPLVTPLALGRLITLYLASAAFQRLDDSTKTCYVSCARVLEASIGAAFDVTKLDDDVVAAHCARRQKGGITYSRTRQTKAGPRTTVVTTGPAQTRTYNADKQLLRIMLNWAKRTRDPATGQWLLHEFPVRGGIVIEQEKNKVRAFATYERFETVMHGLQRARPVATLARDETTLRHLRFLELALVMVEASGRRIEAVSLLRRSDFTIDPARDFADALVRWRPEDDKTGHTQEYPLPQSVARRVYALLEERMVPADGLCFPKRYDASRAVSPDELTTWLREFEKSLGLPKLPRGVWHPYRRKWSKERKHLPMKDVMAAGGWRDVKTFMDSYNEPDLETMRQVAEEPERQRAARQAAAERATSQATVGQRNPLIRRRPAGVSREGTTARPNSAEVRVLPLVRRDGVGAPQHDGAHEGR